MRNSTAGPPGAQRRDSGFEAFYHKVTGRPAQSTVNSGGGYESGAITSGTLSSRASLQPIGGPSRGSLDPRAPSAYASEDHEEDGLNRRERAFVRCIRVALAVLGLLYMTGAAAVLWSLANVVAYLGKVYPLPWDLTVGGGCALLLLGLSCTVTGAAPCGKRTHRLLGISVVSLLSLIVTGLAVGVLVLLILFDSGKLYRGAVTADSWNASVANHLSEVCQFQSAFGCSGWATPCASKTPPAPSNMTEGFFLLPQMGAPPAPTPTTTPTSTATPTATTTDAPTTHVNTTTTTVHTTTVTEAPTSTTAAPALPVAYACPVCSQPTEPPTTAVPLTTATSTDTNTTTRMTTAAPTTTKMEWQLRDDPTTVAPPTANATLCVDAFQAQCKAVSKWLVPALIGVIVVVGLLPLLLASQWYRYVHGEGSTGGYDEVN